MLRAYKVFSQKTQPRLGSRMNAMLSTSHTRAPVPRGGGWPPSVALTPLQMSPGSQLQRRHCRAGKEIQPMGIGKSRSTLEPWVGQSLPRLGLSERGSLGKLKMDCGHRLRVSPRQVGRQALPCSLHTPAWNRHLGCGGQGTRGRGARPSRPSPVSWALGPLPVRRELGLLVPSGSMAGGQRRPSWPPN